MVSLNALLKWATQLVIEHQLDVIAQADFIANGTRSGGDAGGTVVCQARRKPSQPVRTRLPANTSNKLHDASPLDPTAVLILATGCSTALNLRSSPPLG